jgi:hypothetical protein
MVHNFICWLFLWVNAISAYSQKLKNLQSSLYLKLNFGCCFWCVLRFKTFSFSVLKYSLSQNPQMNISSLTFRVRMFITNKKSFLFSKWVNKRDIMEKQILTKTAVEVIQFWGIFLIKISLLCYLNRLFFHMMFVVYHSKVDCVTTMKKTFKCQSLILWISQVKP